MWCIAQPVIVRAWKHFSTSFYILFPLLFEGQLMSFYMSALPLELVYYFDIVL